MMKKTIEINEEFNKLMQEISEKPLNKIILLKEKSAESWNDWKWQLKNRIKSLKELEEYIELTEEEKEVYSNPKAMNLPLSITPYYLNLLNENETHSLRKTIIPTYEEFNTYPEESQDPLNEHKSEKVDNIIHRYPDRVLFLVTNFCSVNCRYCTRSRIIEENSIINKKYWEIGLNYIKEHKEIRDVLISGGDPLTLEDNAIEYLLSELKKIEHVEFIRIGTKIPVVMPQRITENLLSILKKYNNPLFLSIHFTHPDEITEEVKKVCNLLADNGIVMGSQTVLLKGINNDSSILKSLYHQLLKIRVRPYYLYQCDLILGSKHFRTTIDEGLQIMKELRGHTTGYAIPTYVVDAPGGGGKIPMLPNYYQGKTEDGKIILKNYQDNIYIYKE